MAKKERVKKEKPLDKMTAKELRELALAETKIVGVHGMNKAELLAAIKDERGIVEEKKKKGGDVRVIKKKIKALREEKEAAAAEGDKQRTQVLRRRISRLRKKTRRAAA
ncbi:MAG: transcription termination factor Rho [Proteobacteria bacterium]|nr:transcription termination factor Rho [Pseudomonadota bacterium]